MGNMQQQEGLFRFQLDMLMKEIQLIDNAIGRLDELMLRNRNWGITLWAGLMVIILRDGNFERSFVLVTAVIPMLFWLIDIRWKMALLRCSDRQNAISDFLNSSALQEAFEMNAISSIALLDPIGARLPTGEWHYIGKAIRYKDTPIFYPGQILGSLLLFILL